jgi:hypothetical protein
MGEAVVAAFMVEAVEAVFTAGAVGSPGFTVGVVAGMVEAGGSMDLAAFTAVAVAMVAGPTWVMAGVVMH